MVQKQGFFMRFLCALLFILLTAACGGSKADQLVGTWSGDDEIAFYSDGTYQVDGEYGEWTIVNGDILKLSDSGSAETFTIITLHGDTLELGREDGKTAVFHRD